MNSGKRKIVVAVTGASGAIYADLLVERLTGLNNRIEELAVVFSKNALEIRKFELKKQAFEEENGLKLYHYNDFYAAFASGSAQFDTMIICPCSVGTLGRIANGISDDLITRAADVMLKERRKLILVLRETPYSLVHIENMKTVTLSGGIICPATPSFYSNPQTISEVVLTVVDRVVSLAGFEHDGFEWGKEKN